MTNQLVLESQIYTPLEIFYLDAILTGTVLMGTVLVARCYYTNCGTTVVTVGIINDSYSYVEK